jgi:glycerol kinase
LLSTLAWQIPGERIFALEGSCFIAGAAVQWLRDGLGLIESASQSEQLANSVPNSGGVVFVPALTGLGAPYWDADARGLICGLTRGTTAGHVARATLEAIAFQVDDLLRIMKRDMAATQVPLGRLRVDGGACQNNLLMQMQADISGLVVDRPMEIESTARGAALLAGLGVGLFSTTKEAAAAFALDRSFSPTVTNQERESFRGAWEQAVARARS